MHPPYTAEKSYARQVADRGESVLAVSLALRERFPELSLYVRDTIARHAVEDAERAPRVGVCVSCDQAISLAGDGAWEDESGACGCGDGEHEPA